MNQLIDSLKAKLNSLAIDASQIESELQIEYNKVFDGMAFIKDTVTKLESSQDYTWDKYGEIASFLRFDLSDFNDCRRQYFETYMLETHCVNVDWDSYCLLYNQGPCIVINEDGHVLDQDSSKWFLSKKDYLDENDQVDETKRNALIEAYMERTGCYPGVFSSDRHGNLVLVNTNKV